ncbi:MAG: hypothetical protein F6K24_02875 [Okeania sp. SIO2D1]|nr:hypothetical protein [Okeania sp. SIO2D1]
MQAVTRIINRIPLSLRTANPGTIKGTNNPVFDSTIPTSNVKYPLLAIAELKYSSIGAIIALLAMFPRYPWQ